MEIEHLLNQGKMLPLHAARVSDFGPHDRFWIECACGRAAMIPPYVLLHEMRLRPDDRIADLAARLRCRECDERVKVVVSVKWSS